VNHDTEIKEFHSELQRYRCPYSAVLCGEMQVEVDDPITGKALSFTLETPYRVLASGSYATDGM
jgi:hypothetical protein